MNDVGVIGLAALLGVVCLVAFAVFARRQEPKRYWRLAPWAIAAMLAVGVLILEVVTLNR
jgi:ABC-type transport system involved in cytochrome c biogenesis permease subunit